MPHLSSHFLPSESQYFDVTVRAAKRDSLMKDLALDLAPTVRAQAKFLADKYTKRE